MEINFCDWAKKIFPQPSLWKCRISPHNSSTDKSLFSSYKLYNSCNLFSANKTFLLHVVLFISKSFNLNVYALLVVPFPTAAAVCHKISIIWFNIIMKVSFPTDTIYIKKHRNSTIAIKSFIGLWKRQKFFYLQANQEGFTN